MRTLARPCLLPSWLHARKCPHRPLLVENLVFQSCPLELFCQPSADGTRKCHLRCIPFSDGLGALDFKANSIVTQNVGSNNGNGDHYGPTVTAPYHNEDPYGYGGYGDSYDAYGEEARILIVASASCPTTERVLLVMAPALSINCVEPCLGSAAEGRILAPTSSRSAPLHLLSRLKRACCALQGNNGYGRKLLQLFYRDPSTGQEYLVQSSNNRNAVSLTPYTDAVLNSATFSHSVELDMHSVDRRLGVHTLNSKHLCKGVRHPLHVLDALACRKLFQSPREGASTASGILHSHANRRVKTRC